MKSNAPKSNSSKSSSTPSTPFFDPSAKDAFFQPQKEGGEQAFVQPKLKIGQPNDRFEQEADQMADQVVNKIAQSDTTPSIQNQEEDQLQKQEENTEDELQMKCDACAHEEQVQKQPEEEIQQQSEDELQTKAEVSIQKQEGEIQEQSEDELQTMPEEEIQQQSEDELQTKAEVSIQKQEEEIQEQSEDELQTMPEEEIQQQSEDELQTKAEVNIQKQEEEIQEQSEDELQTMPEEEIQEKRQFPIQTKGGRNRTASTELQKQLNATKGQGDPLDKDTKSNMESAFGADFGGVRIHTGSDAAGMNQELGAKAFTHGSDVYFGEGNFQPGSKDGQNLLAHELTHTIQQGAADKKKVQKKPADHAVDSDGANVENRMKNKTQDEVGDDADFNKSEGSMSAEEREKARDVDPNTKNQESGKIQSAGTAKPDVDRPANELPSVEASAEEGERNLEEQPSQEGQEQTPEENPRADLGSSEMREQSAAAALARAQSIKMPPSPEPLPEPRIEAPTDVDNQPLPARSDLDQAVRALHEIAKLFVENAYDLKREAASDQQSGAQMRAKLDESWAKTERVNAGSTVMKEDRESREEINNQEEEALVKVEEDTAMVKAEAPGLMDEANEGQEEAGPMVEEANEQKEEMEAEKPDDPDAARDAEQQSQETNQVAEGSASFEQAFSGTGERAEQYLNDATAGEEKNTQTRATIDENRATLGLIDQEINRIDTHNAESEAQLAGLDNYPALVEQQTVQRAESGEQLYSAAVNMNRELVDTQEEYLNSMKGLPNKETAQRELDEREAQENPVEEAEQSPEEGLLMEMSNMDEAQLDATLASMDETQLDTLNQTLDGMETQEEAEAGDEPGVLGQADAVGRQQVDLNNLFSSGDPAQAPQDPRQEEINEIEGRRQQRIEGVKQVSDANFSHLSAEQKAMLAQKLAMQDAVSGLFNMDILEMGKGMIMGMINPIESLKGVVDGANKLLTGAVNLFNAEAWKADPLGNLLQSAADIATGLTMIFMSITGLATAITIIMTAITIASLGFAAPITGPVISFMATVITTVGGWTVVTGLIALALNALTYVKNLHDAGVAENTDELIFESGQIKQNMTDGFTSAMAVVGGKGDADGAAAMLNKIDAAGGATAFARQMPGNFRQGITSGARGVVNMGRRVVGGVKSISRAGVSKVKNAFQRAYQRIRGGLDEGLDDLAPTRRPGGALDEVNPPRTRTPDTPDGVRVARQGELGSVGGQKVKAEMDFPDGHRAKSLETGQCAICSQCKTIRNRFRKELMDDADFSTRLRDVETRLKQNPADRDLIIQQKTLHDELYQRRMSRIETELNGTRPGTKKHQKLSQELGDLQQGRIDTNLDLYDQLVDNGQFTRHGKTDVEIEQIRSNMDAELSGGRRVNPETGRMIGPDGKEIDIKAQKTKQEFEVGDQQSSMNPRRDVQELKVDHSELTPAQRQRLDDLKTQRSNAQKAKQDVDAEFNKPTQGEYNGQHYDRVEDIPKWKEEHGKMLRASEGIGEVGADAAIRAKLKGAEPLRAELPGGGKQGEFDLIYEQDGKIYVVEAKGAGSDLTSRVVDGGLRAQQGTAEYFESIISNMKKAARETSDPQIRAELLDSLRKIRRAQKSGNLNYMQVSQRLDVDGNLVQNVNFEQFNIGNITGDNFSLSNAQGT